MNIEDAMRERASASASFRTRMKPASTTSSTVASRSILTSAYSASGSSLVRKFPGGRYAFGTRTPSRCRECLRRKHPLPPPAPPRIRVPSANALKDGAAILPLPEPRMPMPIAAIAYFASIRSIREVVEYPASNGMIWISAPTSCKAARSSSVERLRFVIAALHVNSRPHLARETPSPALPERSPRNRPPPAQPTPPRDPARDSTGALRPLRFAHGRVAVYAHRQRIAQRARGLQITDVSDVEKIETAICHHQAPVTAVQLRGNICQRRGVENLRFHFRSPAMKLNVFGITSKTAGSFPTSSPSTLNHMPGVRCHSDLRRPSKDHAFAIEMFAHARSAPRRAPGPSPDFSEPG